MKATTLRIIGGSMRGRKVRYNGFRTTRPMRDSVRENMFNIIGSRIQGSTVIDPFCGTGILVAEALSRGAADAIAMELDRRTLKQIQENLTDLELLSKTVLSAGDAFRGLGGLLENHPVDRPWVTLLCPPYEMFIKRIEDLNRMIRFVAKLQPDGLVIAESEQQFDCDELTDGQWDVRRYGITQLAVAELSSIQLR